MLRYIRLRLVLLLFCYVSFGLVSFALQTLSFVNFHYVTLRSRHLLGYSGISSVHTKASPPLHSFPHYSTKFLRLRTIIVQLVTINVIPNTLCGVYTLL